MYEVSCSNSLLHITVRVSTEILLSLVAIERTCTPDGEGLIEHIKPAKVTVQLELVTFFFY